MSYNDLDQHLGYETQWTTIRNTSVAHLWTAPEHGAASEDADGDYEEDLSCLDESQAPIDDGNHDPVQDGYWVSGVHYDSGSAQDGASKPPGNDIVAICTQYVSRLMPRAAMASADNLLAYMTAWGEYNVTG
jgi:hypothetical protein